METIIALLIYFEEKLLKIAKIAWAESCILK
jgi:hypothetical protein